jgi:hypothetical protein
MRLSFFPKVKSKASRAPPPPFLFVPSVHGREHDARNAMHRDQSACPEGRENDARNAVHRDQRACPEGREHDARNAVHRDQRACPEGRKNL